MADLGDVLGPSLNAGPVPASGRAIVDYAGGRRALVEQLAGMDGPPRKRDYRSESDYQAARTKWRSASRRVQRWSTEGRQRRAAPQLTPAEKGKIRRQATREKRRQIAARGLRARLRATVRVGSGFAKRDDVRTRTMPSGGPGVFLDPGTVQDVLDELSEEGRDAAAEDFLGAFWEAYGMPDDAEVDEVSWLHVWPDGDPEPE